MQIERVEVTPVQLSLKQPFRTAKYSEPLDRPKAITLSGVSPAALIAASP